MGGTTDEQEGTFGTELLCMVPMQTPEGEAATQPSRIAGHEGPAWLLRSTLMGRAALDDDLAGPWEETIRQVVVRRGRAGDASRCAVAPDAAARGPSRRLNRSRMQFDRD